MSGLYFDAKLEFSNADVAQDFYQVVRSGQEGLEQVFGSLIDREDPKKILSFDFSIEENSNLVLSCHNLDYKIEFYERLANAIASLDLKSYKSRLFDSQSNVVAVWQYPEGEMLDFDGAVVAIIGVDEAEGIHETLEDAGAILKNKVDESALVVIYGDDMDIEPLFAGTSIGTNFLHFDDFWDEFDYLGF